MLKKLYLLPMSLVFLIPTVLLSIYLEITPTFTSSATESSEETVSVEVSPEGEIGSNLGSDIKGANTYLPDDLPDVAIQYRNVPGPPPQQYWVTFENLSEDDVELYYDDGRDGTLQGPLPPGHKLQIGTYVGHQFFYRIKGSPRRLYVTTMETGKIHIPFVDENQRKKEEEELHRQKNIFKKEYREKNGIEWLHTYPRDKPILPFLPTEFVGQKHSIKTYHTYYHCYPVTNKIEDINKCRDDITKPIEFEWEVISLKPKILKLHNFLSDFEADHIIALARPIANRSVVGSGGYSSNTRTSSNAWVKRSFSDVVDWIIRRIGDVVKVDEAHLWDTIGAESLQVVHYLVGQEYKAHHDWRVNRVQTRFLTFLMYLNDQLNSNAGGETEFPKIGLKVHPGKGGVVLFYDLLEDGNVDDLTLHAALPVKEGEKWLANMWIWDPNFS